MFASDALKGQTIVITGGGTGLGRAMAERFAELGARLVLAARQLDRLEATATDLEARFGAEALPLSVDIRKPEACESIVRQAAEKFGAITGLVNNAAGNFLCPSEELSPNGFNTVVDIVLKGTWFMTQAVGRYMIDRQIRGSILSILTTYVHSGSAFVLPSAMAKAGLLAMTRSLAVEWGSAYGIRANAIAPGPFPTEGAWSRLFVDGLVEDEMKKRIPFRRWGDHQELANLAVYLMCPGSGYVNGECVAIDGGEMWQGAGEFNAFVQQDRSQVKQMMAAMRPRKKTP